MPIAPRPASSSGSSQPIRQAGRERGGNPVLPNHQLLSPSRQAALNAPASGTNTNQSTRAGPAGGATKARAHPPKAPLKPTIPCLLEEGSHAMAISMAWAPAMPSTANAAIQPDCSNSASSSTAPLRGLLIRMTWPTDRKPQKSSARWERPAIQGSVRACRVPLVGRRRSRRLLGRGASGSRGCSSP